MPELPEVETVAKQLNESVAGAVLKKKHVFDDKLKTSLRPVPVGLEVASVFRHGKQVVLAFSNEQYLCWHLRMTGRLGFVPSGLEVPENIKRFARVKLILDRGELFFSDVRRFGTCSYCNELPKVAVDPTNKSFRCVDLSQMLQNSGQNLKTFLMRQDRLVGIGNIYASEILYDAGLSPLRRCSELTQEEVKRLFSSTKKILKNAIKHCGTTFSDFQDSYGELGKYQNYLKVYGRHQEECFSCNNPISKVVLGQRSTFFCEYCQK